MARIEIGRSQFRMTLKIEAASLHEAKSFGDAIGKFDVTSRLRAVLDETKHPLTDTGKIGIAALCEGAEQIERRSRLPISFDLPTRVRSSRIFGESDVVYNVAAIARQFLTIALFVRSGALFCKLTRNAADFHHRRSCGVGQYDHHLQEHAEEIADIVCTVLGKAFCTVSALQQERFALCDSRQLLLQIARLPRKYEWRKSRKLPFDIKQRLPVRIIRNLLNWLLAPTIRRPPLGHLATPEFGRPYTRPWPSQATFSDGFGYFWAYSAAARP